MADVLLLITVLAAVGALLGLVRLCDRIVGDDPPAPTQASATATAPSATSAPAASIPSEVAP
jgi:hypothetical protein